MLKILSVDRSVKKKQSSVSTPSKSVALGSSQKEDTTSTRKVETI